MPVKKQISIFLDMDDWLRLRLHSAKIKKPITVIAREYLEPLFDKLKAEISDDELPKST